MPQALGTRSATRVRVNSAASTVDSSANRQCAISKLFAPPALLPRDQMAGATGLEPATSCATRRRSNQLHHGPETDQKTTCLTSSAMHSLTLSYTFVFVI